MPKIKLPPGTNIFEDRSGSSVFYRAWLGAKFTGGKPRKKAFATKAAAAQWISDQAKARRTETLELTADQLADARAALTALGGKASLVEAADLWLARTATVGKTKTVQTGIDLLLAEKSRENLSPSHLRELRSKLDRIFHALKTKPLADLTREDMRKAFSQPMLSRTRLEQKVSPQQQVKRQRYANILIAFAIDEGWIAHDSNPLRGVNPPKILGSSVTVLTPVETARLLNAASAEFSPGLAIKIFAGLRNEELWDLKWGDIVDAQIVVQAAFAKTGNRRIVTIHRTLNSWLEKARREDDCLVASPAKKFSWLEELVNARTRAGFTDWPQNVLRHSFGSYHYALHRNESLTAAEMGNSPAVVRKHYVNAVRKRACEAFWQLTPAWAEAVANGAGQGPEFEELPEHGEGE
jgi:integrase